MSNILDSENPDVNIRYFVLIGTIKTTRARKLLTVVTLTLSRTGPS